MDEAHIYKGEELPGESCLPILESSLHRTLGVGLLQVLPFVVELLSFTQTKLKLGAALPKVEGNRNEGVALLGGLADQPTKLSLVQQQLSCLHLLSLT